MNTVGQPSNKLNNITQNQHSNSKTYYGKINLHTPKSKENFQIPKSKSNIGPKLNIENKLRTKKSTWLQTFMPAMVCDMMFAQLKEYDFSHGYIRL